jgi:hypothetical protein
MDWDGAPVDCKRKKNRAGPKRREIGRLEIGYGFQERKYLT